MSRIFTVLFIFTLLFSGIPTFAQEAQGTQPAPPVSGTVDGEAVGSLNCFDWYTFGSVQADLQSSVASTVPGATMTFAGEVKSENPYPLLDGTLYVKIFKRDEGTFAEGDGNLVVDQFVIKEGITLPPKGTLPVSYEWQVPVNAEGGEYYAAYFFTTAKRYNLMGLSFTDDVVGNQAPFTIIADNTIAKLSKPDTTLSGRNHHFAAFPLKFDAAETVLVKTTITNPSDQPKTLPLQWNQYAWDAMLEDNLRFTRTELVTLAPNETKEVTYEAQPQRESVVYITAVAQDNEAKSILDIRYVREGIEETRINFPGISTFPLAKDTDTTLFACAHSTNLPVVPDNTLTLTLKDRDGNMIHEYTHTGDIPGAMSGFGESFKPTKNINYATLTARLERNGVIVEEVTQTYDCTVIDANSCLPETKEGGGSLFDTLKHNALTLIIALFALTVGVALAILFIKRRGNHTDSGPTMTTPTAFLFFLLLLPSLFFGQPGVGEAETKSATWSSGSLPSLFYCWNRWGSAGDSVAGGDVQSRTCTTYEYKTGYLNWERALTGAQVTAVQYYAKITNADTGQNIDTGTSVPVGTKIKIESLPHDESHVSWIGTGYSMDSPNGEWRVSANPPAWQQQSYAVPFLRPTTTSMMNGPVCESKDTVTRSSATYSRVDSIHIPFVVAIPSGKTTTASTNLSCATPSVNAAGTFSQVCTVNATGNIDISLNIPATYGKFYYRYHDSGGITGGFPNFTFLSAGCYNNDQELRQATLFDATTGSVKKGGISASDYQLTIPAQTITFNLSAVTSNNPPATPTITGAATGVTNTPYTFNFSATDPDGDQVAYYLSDSACTAEVERFPGTANTFVNSGTSRSKSTSWSTTGNKTLYVFAKDSKGGKSACAQHTIALSAAPAITVDLKVNGSDTSINVAKNAMVNLTWSSENAASCSKWGGVWGSGQAIALDNTSPGVNVAVTATTTFMVNCGGVSDSVTVNVKNQKPNPPTITYVSGTKETGKTITFAIQGVDPDNDDVFYEVDWMDGTPLATTMTVPSNSIRNANHSWSTDGTKTFRARTVDTAGAKSAWTSHSEDITIAIPSAPTSVTATCPVPGT
ncbi:MAG: hypothetical protein RL538_853, partial [Candidatus Parcubacteria bacterium]